MLIAEGLVKRYGRRPALDGFDLEVASGEIVGLIGHNGAGKTTFVEVVTGLVRPDTGQVRIGGIDALRAGRAARQLLGVAPQELALYNRATVRENLRLFAAISGLRGRHRDRQIARVLDELHLAALANRLVGVLSGGQRRRVQAATAMVASPPLLLLDEPTAGADPETRSALLAAVKARAEAGTAVLYTTHYLPELVDLDATLALARAGRVIARGTQQELTRHLPGELLVTFADPGEPDLRLPTTDPGADLAALLASGRTPVSVDVRRPSLDDLYRSLEAAAGDGEQETRDVAA
ncbi:daunorubicin resistance protein DrrA family ABC transporter ATP-binding protein [Planotetraspora phitsanulokensis]|uniref:Daunorubicin resistance protein DrrA family ABC transporter ATP-binding protein n=1 Tax=Planotetraspora phitsanulokensis TaxID=575192 RepID=A0A8J3XC10_9ACTN|nr:ABC transporter ATP-binding protein [Planotetraspora phitsanulokensis]GII35632.1 daunorubicin resistance protein DrrA family ABC transporter ATP-binding protein [Planotetraspora phitsanulokensis]